ncbi:hypothetical protein [Embleya hyalina]|uniref:Lipoprotein n=1 Tax=Embleya hyalina TaxID=516124 RepID=A0A401YR15_9ACTN|nr:hypothetical protein [Embleya hyalina]GCD97033.1 hypothetical protein EHYA_04720 [Embleya hyalina]
MNMRTGVIAVAALCLLLAGCGSDGDGRKSIGQGIGQSAETSGASPAERSEAVVAPPSSPPASETGAPSAAVPASPETAPPGTVTKAGTRLKLGESAVSEYTSGSKKGLVQVRPLAIEKGSTRDLEKAGFALKEDQKNIVPFYVRVAYTNLSDTDLSYTMPNIPLGGVDDRRQRMQPAILYGKLDKCSSSTFASFTKGVTREDCAVFLLPAAGSLDAVDFRMPDFTSPPIEWSR